MIIDETSMLGTEDKGLTDTPSQQEVDQIVTLLVKDASPAQYSKENIEGLKKVLKSLPVTRSANPDQTDWMKEIVSITAMLKNIGINYSVERANFFRQAFLFKPDKDYNLQSLGSDFIRLYNIGIPMEGSHLKYYKALFKTNGFLFASLLESLYDTKVFYKNKKSVIIYESFLYAFEKNNNVALMLQQLLGNNISTGNLIHVLLSHRNLFFNEIENKSIDALLGAGCSFRSRTQIEILILIKNEKLKYQDALILFDIFRSISDARNNERNLQLYRKDISNHLYNRYIRLYKLGLNFKKMKEGDIYSYVIKTINQHRKISIDDIVEHIIEGIALIYKKYKSKPSKLYEKITIFINHIMPEVSTSSGISSKDIIGKYVIALLKMDIEPTDMFYKIYANLFFGPKNTCTLINFLQSINFMYSSEQDSSFIDFLTYLLSYDTSMATSLFDSIIASDSSYTDNPYPILITKLGHSKLNTINKIIDLHQVGIFYDEKNRAIYNTILQNRYYGDPVDIKKPLLALQNVGILFNDESFMLYLKLLELPHELDFLSAALCTLYSKNQTPLKTLSRLLTSITSNYTNLHLCIDLCLLLHELNYEYNDKTADVYHALFSYHQKQSKMLSILKLIRRSDVTLTCGGPIIDCIMKQLDLHHAYNAIDAPGFEHSILLEIISSNNINLIDDLLDAHLLIQDHNNKLFYKTLSSLIKVNNKTTLEDIIIKMLSQKIDECASVNFDPIMTLDHKKELIKKILGITLDNSILIDHIISEIKRLHQLANITHGPLNKSYATYKIEQLVCNLSDTPFNDIQCSFEEPNHYTIQGIDLTLLLRHANLSHLELDSHTIKGLDMLLNEILGINKVREIEKEIESKKTNSSVLLLSLPLKKALYLYTTDDYFIQLNRMFRGEQQESIDIAGQNTVLCCFIIGILATTALNKLPLLLYDNNTLVEEKKIIKKMASHYNFSEIFSNERYIATVYKALEDNVIDHDEFYQIVHAYFEIAPLINPFRKLIRCERKLDPEIIDHRCAGIYTTSALTSTSCLTDLSYRLSSCYYTIFNNAPNLPSIASVSDKPHEQEIILPPGTQLLYKPTGVNNNFSANIILTPDNEHNNYWIEHALLYAYKNHLSKPYKDIDASETFDGIQVARPNHGLPHTYTVIKLIRPVIYYFRSFAIDEVFKSFCEKLISNNSHIIEIAAAFSVTGRESEFSYHDNTARYLAYRHASAANLANYLQKKFRSPARVHQDRLIDAVREMGNINYKSSDIERIFVQIILSFAHNLDLPRCCSPTRSQESIDIFNQYIEPSDQQQDSLVSLCCYANKMIKARKDRLCCKPNKHGIFQAVAEHYQKDFGINCTSLKSLSDCLATVAKPLPVRKDPKKSTPFSFK